MATESIIISIDSFSRRSVGEFQLALEDFILASENRDEGEPVPPFPEALLDIFRGIRIIPGDVIPQDARDYADGLASDYFPNAADEVN